MLDQENTEKSFLTSSNVIIPCIMRATYRYNRFISLNCWSYPSMKKTKIVCTIGPKSEPKAVMAKMILSRMSIDVINSSIVIC